MIAAQAKKTQNNKQGIQKEEKFSRKKVQSLHKNLGSRYKIGSKAIASGGFAPCDRGVTIEPNPPQRVLYKQQRRVP